MVKSYGAERLGNPVSRVQAGMDNGDELAVTAVKVSRSQLTLHEKLLINQSNDKYNGYLFTGYIVGVTKAA